MASAGSKSVISKDMQELGQGREDVSHSIQGHKANLSNPSKSCRALHDITGILLTATRHKRAEQEEQRQGDRGAWRRRQPVRQGG